MTMRISILLDPTQEALLNASTLRGQRQQSLAQWGRGRECR